jgi:PAS domain-containing protein
LGSLQRALLGPAAALPLAAGLLAAVLGADAQAVLAAALAGLLLGDGLMAWALLRLPRASVLPLAGQALAQHGGDGMLVLDERGRVLVHNPAAQRRGCAPARGRGAGSRRCRRHRSCHSGC